MSVSSSILVPAALLAGTLGAQKHDEHPLACLDAVQDHLQYRSEVLPCFQVDTGEHEDDDDERPSHIALDMDQGLRPEPIHSSGA